MFMGVWNGPAASLGELALREAVRRQAVNASMRKVADADLGPAPARVPKPAVAETIDAAKPAEKLDDPPKPAEPIKDETWWRARMVTARVALERDRLLLEALQNRVRTLTRDAASRDDPAQRAVLLKERIRALEELELMRKLLAADAEAIAAIEEEARQAGVPPGWIRSE
jgi:hypothetical protein